MDKKGPWQWILNPKTIVFTLGGVFLGLILFNTQGYAITGGIIGFIASIFMQ